MTVLGKTWNMAVRLVQEPISNEITGKGALAAAFGVVCAAYYAVATGHDISIVLPVAAGMTGGLALIKTACGIYQLQK
jgi:hypothetical protein